MAEEDIARTKPRGSGRGSATCGRYRFEGQLKVFRARVRAHEGPWIREGAVMVEDPVAVIEIQCASNVSIRISHTKDETGGVFTAVFVDRVAIFDRSLGAMIVVTQLDVHNTGNGIRAVSGGSAILQNFNALNGGRWNRLQIGEHDADDTDRVGGN